MSNKITIAQAIKNEAKTDTVFATKLADLVYGIDIVKTSQSTYRYGIAVSWLFVDGSMLVINEQQNFVAVHDNVTVDMWRDNQYGKIDFHTYD